MIPGNRMGGWSVTGKKGHPLQGSRCRVDNKDTLLPGPFEKSHRKYLQNVLSLGNNSIPPLVKACPWNVDSLWFPGCANMKDLAPSSILVQGIWESSRAECRNGGASGSRCCLLTAVGKVVVTVTRGKCVDGCEKRSLQPTGLDMDLKVT